jgi:hypothetical protein
MTLYTEVTYYNAGAKLNIFNLRIDLRFRHQAVWREAHGQDPCSCSKKSVAYHNWFALPERPVFDARAPFVLPEYSKMALSKSVMRNVARFRIRGQMFLKVISKVLFSNITQRFTNSLVHLSIFLIDLFVGTYRLSSYCQTGGLCNPNLTN